MNALLAARLTIAGAGILVWAYGARESLATFRWVGIGAIALAMLLRFTGPRATRDHDLEQDDEQG